MSNARNPAFRSASWNHPQSHTSRIPQTPHSLPQRSVSEAFSLAGRAHTNDTAPPRSSPLSHTLTPDSTSDDGLDVSMSEPDGSVFNSSPSMPPTRFARSLKNASQHSPFRQRLLERRHSMQVSATRQRVLNNFYNSTGHTPPSYHQPHPDAPSTVVPSTPTTLNHTPSLSSYSHYLHTRPAASPYNRSASSPHIPPAAFPNNQSSFSHNTDTHESIPARPSTTTSTPTPVHPQLQYQQSIQARLQQHHQQQAQTFLQAQQAREQKIQSEFRKAQTLQLPPPTLFICSLCDLQFTQSIECIPPDEAGRAYCEECIIKCATRVLNEQKAKIAEEEWAENEVSRVGADVEMVEGAESGGEQGVSEGLLNVGENYVRTAIAGEGVVAAAAVAGGLSANFAVQSRYQGDVQTVVQGETGAASPSADTWTGILGDDDFGFDYDAYFLDFESPQGSG